MIELWVKLKNGVEVSGQYDTKEAIRRLMELRDNPVVRETVLDWGLR